MGASCSGPCYWNVLSAAVDDKRYRLGALCLGAVYLVAGVVAIACGSLMLVHGASHTTSGESLPWLVGTPIWGGAVSVLGGILGLCVFLTAIPLKHRIGLMYAFYGCSFGVMSTAIQVMTNSVKSYSLCTGSNQVDCSPETDLMASLSLVAIVMAAIILLDFTGVMVWYGVLHCSARRMAKRNLSGCDNGAAEKHGCA